jgi:hypothetical protein
MTLPPGESTAQPMVRQSPQKPEERHERRFGAKSIGCSLDTKVALWDDESTASWIMAPTAFPHYGCTDLRVILSMLARFLKGRFVSLRTPHTQCTRLSLTSSFKSGSPSGDPPSDARASQTPEVGLCSRNSMIGKWPSCGNRVGSL